MGGALASLVLTVTASAQENRIESNEKVRRKGVAIFAPKPDYPLEARSKHWGGSGIVLLDVETKTGEATSARMLKSTGHQILDEALLQAFRRWRFIPGRIAPHVKIPVTYTMEGASY